VTREPPGTGAPPGSRPPGRVGLWVVGARPRTLAAAAVPVLVGTALGWWLNHSAAHPVTGSGRAADLIVWRAVCALVVALGVQVGTNYANDYADGVRGTDRARVGPVRLVGSGLARPGAVRTAALVSFGIAGVAGLALAAATSWWLLAVGAACFAAGWLYTGGPRPYGYLGLGELFVFVFFGLVATMGSAYVQAERLTTVSLVAAVPVGLLATALLEANNLRDIAGDADTGKRTLAVRLGRRRAGWLYIGSLVAAAAGVAVLAYWRPFALLALLATPLAVRPVRLVRSGAEGRELLPALGSTGRLQLAGGVLLALGIVL
jgi:1,4-dihydroxy-2-naphthoate polyprenyltransferase